MTLYQPNQKVKKLAQALLTLQDQKELILFLRDLLTEPEIEELAGRLSVAIALSEGKSQRVVAKETGVSIATVTRVNQWLKRGMGGYQKVIAALKASNDSHSLHHSTKQ
ncbi:MAG: YerC/YecD family TrpR-related protein [Candidatus Dojkabacteria bacterium]|nr:MAG: YerC/YecD family TrpR-related protein [Candidatus Dojkabacteria bacterium]